MAQVRLGISLYPEHSTQERDFAYMEAAAAHGFDVLFIGLLGAQEGRDALIARYRPLLERAKELGFEVEADVNPMFFDRMGVQAHFFAGALDLSLFTELGVDVLRLDLGLADLEEAALTKNREGIKICMNGATLYDHPGNVLSCGGVPERMVGCMNYYPHRYTGTSLESYEMARDIWATHNLRFQTFVSSQSPDAFGPWPVTEGLPTLEIHRNLPIAVQVKHYLLMGGVSDIVIGNAYATEGELSAMARAARSDVVELHVELEDGLPSHMRALLDIPMSRRGDSRDYLIRTFETRLANKSRIEPFNTVDMAPGDVLVDNELYGQYSGEVQIALKPMDNSGKTNVIGHVVEDELLLLDHIQGGQRFAFDL